MNTIKIWVDDIRDTPTGYIGAKSVNETINLLNTYKDINLLDLDHDSGDYYSDGGDYIKILDYLVYNPDIIVREFRLHTMNPVGRDNMRTVIQGNSWKEIY